MGQLNEPGTARGLSLSCPPMILKARWLGWVVSQLPTPRVSHPNPNHQPPTKGYVPDSRFPSNQNPVLAPGFFNHVQTLKWSKSSGCEKSTQNDMSRINRASPISFGWNCSPTSGQTWGWCPIAAHLKDGFSRITAFCFSLFFVPMLVHQSIGVTESPPKKTCTQTHMACQFLKQQGLL